MSAMTISSSPVDAIMPGAALVTGVENGRVYLGARYKGIHVHPEPAAFEQIEEAWRGAFMGHLFARGWAREDLCGCTDTAVSA